MEIISNILTRVRTSIVIVMIAIVSFLTSFFLPYYSGLWIGEMINPTAIEYECVCDSAPVLTQLQALIIVIIYLFCLSVGLYQTLHLLNFSKNKCRLWMSLLLILNGFLCFGVLDILSTEVSG